MQYCFSRREICENFHCIPSAVIIFSFFFFFSLTVLYKYHVFSGILHLKGKCFVPSFDFEESAHFINLLPSADT